MRLISSAILACILAGAAYGQSGRLKPSASPTPTPPRVAPGGYILTQEPNKTVIQTRPVVVEEKDDVIKVASTLVPIPVSILDTSRRTLANLAAKDFELKIDGQPVEIDEVFRSTTPIRLAMLFDNSGSVFVAREFEKQAAIRFFESVVRPDRDLAALFSVADYTRLEQPFTNDVDRLKFAINSFPQPAGATALLDGIVKATDYLSSASGRRVIVIVSDGEDTYSDPKNTLEEVVKTLHRANVQVYVVKTKDFENFKRTGVRAGNANIHSLAAERRMLEITSQTGGAVYSPIDERELSDVFRQISAELSEQYVLAYYPENESEKRGQYRAISVAVKRDNVSLRARKGYYVRN
jgi:Ca-activated chloride channel homolog